MTGKSGTKSKSTPKERPAPTTRQSMTILALSQELLRLRKRFQSGEIARRKAMREIVKLKLYLKQISKDVSELKKWKETR